MTLNPPGGLQHRPPGAYLASMDSFAVTERAASRIAEIVASQGSPAALRVAVLAGGCSGFQYRFELDAEAEIGRAHV